jgi:AcrR family transcriptional regulator
VLAAADALFADADAPHAVSMDAIAAAAGVGKGTLFRAFGSRDGLLDALSAAKFTPLREAVEGGEPPLGLGTPSRERIVAFLDALLTFKLENRHLHRAREVASSGVLLATGRSPQAIRRAQAELARAVVDGLVGEGWLSTTPTSSAR